VYPQKAVDQKPGPGQTPPCGVDEVGQALGQ
jgi:hypothetical protein